MTAATTAALVVIGALACLNLLLTYGVVRRLRSHEERIAELGEGGEGMPMSDWTPRVGTTLPEFRVTALDGGEVTRDQLATGEAYVGFFSVHCPPCRERLPEFVDIVSRRQGDALVVISGAPDERREEMVAMVGDAARVVVDDHDPGTLEQLLQVERLPCMLVLSDGVVTANAAIIGQLPAAARA